MKQTANQRGEGRQAAVSAPVKREKKRKVKRFGVKN